VLSRLAAPTTALLLLLAGCGDGGASGEESAADVMETPELGACRTLTPQDIAEPDNADAVVPCGVDHTAQTFAVGTFPADVAEGGYMNPDLGAYVYETCSRQFEKFLGGDESAVMRSTLTWAWFRPSENAWEQNARWYRCDVVAGTETSIKVGREDDPYPGDRLVEVRSRDFCSDSVGAWMNYPVDYEFGYTFFREADWKAGNRRSICWARTDK
jgi:hypothetical protein